MALAPYVVEVLDDELVDFLGLHVGHRSDAELARYLGGNDRLCASAAESTFDACNDSSSRLRRQLRLIS